MKRIILHWTAGGNRANATDKKHYHVMFEGDGQIVEGKHLIEDNESTSDGHYAAHTLNANTGSIGLALCGMRKAKEKPFDPGPSPYTRAALDAMIQYAATCCIMYNIPVTPQTVLSHAEVEDNLGIKQRNKWDITWLPGATKLSSARAVGDYIRQEIQADIDMRRRRDLNNPEFVKPGVFTPDQAKKGGIIALIVAAIAALIAFR